MTPRQIVEYLDDYIIGQNDAKKTIALALRNRYRRMRVEPKLQEEIMPKNILIEACKGDLLKSVIAFSKEWRKDKYLKLSS